MTVVVVVAEVAAAEVPSPACGNDERNCVAAPPPLASKVCDDNDASTRGCGAALVAEVAAAEVPSPACGNDERNCVALSEFGRGTEDALT